MRHFFCSSPENDAKLFLWHFTLMDLTHTWLIWHLFTPKNLPYYHPATLLASVAQHIQVQLTANDVIITELDLQVLFKIHLLNFKCIKSSSRFCNWECSTYEYSYLALGSVLIDVGLLTISDGDDLWLHYISDHNVRGLAGKVSQSSGWFER